MATEWLITGVSWVMVAVVRSKVQEPVFDPEEGDMIQQLVFVLWWPVPARLSKIKRKYNN